MGFTNTVNQSHASSFGRFNSTWRAISASAFIAAPFSGSSSSTLAPSLSPMLAHQIRYIHHPNAGMLLHVMDPAIAEAQQFCNVHYQIELATAA